jgi:nucleoside 2-deoxyribosyltransferase
VLHCGSLHELEVGMLIYIASRWEHRENLTKICDKLRELGHEITARWITRVQPDKNHADWEKQASKFATEDFDDIERADLVIVDTTCPLDGITGGFYTELGYGIRARKLVWVVGKRTNVFTHHPVVTPYEDWREVYESLS